MNLLKKKIILKIIDKLKEEQILKLAIEKLKNLITPPKKWKIILRLQFIIKIHLYHV